MERMAREPLTTLDSIGAALAGFTARRRVGRRSPVP
jgi:hypothetical protein